MPNWCFGKLRIYGDSDKIVNFLEHGLVVSSDKNYNDYVTITRCENQLCMEFKDGEIHIQGTRRGFVMQNQIVFDTTSSYLELDIMQAWAVNAFEMSMISKKYKVDFKISSYELMVGFEQDIEIFKGVIVKDLEITK